MDRSAARGVSNGREELADLCRDALLSRSGAKQLTHSSGDAGQLFLAQLRSVSHVNAASGPMMSKLNWLFEPTPLDPLTFSTKLSHFMILPVEVWRTSHFTTAR